MHNILELLVHISFFERIDDIFEVSQFIKFTATDLITNTNDIWIGCRTIEFPYYYRANLAVHLEPTVS